MSRIFVDTSSQYLETTAGAPVSGAPLAFCGWINPTANLHHSLLSVQDKDTASDWFLIRAKHTGSGVHVANFWARSSAALPEASSTTTFLANSGWHHICGIEYAINSRAVFLDGVGKGTNTTSCTPSGLDSISIGRVGDSSPGGYIGGGASEIAIWDLSAWPGSTGAEKGAEFERVAVPALAKGFSPDNFPLGILSYWRLVRDEDQDRVGGYDLTAYNTPSIADHPPMIYPATPWAIAPPSVMAVGNPWNYYAQM